MPDQEEGGDETIKVDQSKNSPEEPAAKKLRSSDPDLKVTLKYEDNNNKSCSKSYDMYAQVFARQSQVVDTMLSHEMKEKQTREIELHDVTPHVFELALTFLEDPSAVLSMKAEDALKIVDFYDKYEFVSGLGLCDGVLHNYVDKAYQAKTQPPENLDFLVDVIVASERYRLTKTKSAGYSYLFSRFLASQPGHFGAEMFSVDHIQKLQPFFQNEDMLLPVTVSKEELASPLFPKYFVEVVSHKYTRNLLKAIVVCGSVSSANGKYVRKDNGRRFEGEVRPTSWDGRLAQCYVDRCDASNGDWSIVARYLPGGTEVVLWKCPNSQSLECPPIEPWNPVAPQVSSHKPTIKYVKYSDNKS